MPPTLIRAAALFFLVALASVAVRAEEPASEKQKIEALLQYIERLTDAKFVRNDSEYDAATAVKFMRSKWNSEGNAIKTAKDFIDKCATVSSTSGKPYLIRFKDGKEVKCAELLLKELEKLNPPAK
jgi:hypothetical protein